MLDISTDNPFGGIISFQLTYDGSFGDEKKKRRDLLPQKLSRMIKSADMFVKIKIIEKKTN